MPQTFSNRIPLGNNTVYFLLVLKMLKVLLEVLIGYDIYEVMFLRELESL